MPQIILGPQQYAPRIDGSVKGKAYSFLAKLAESDTSAGLHIEPIASAIDPRVRTGRVDEFWRAVLFKAQGHEDEAVYVYLGMWPHDDAIEFAKKAKLQVNPVNGIAELLISDSPSLSTVDPYRTPTRTMTEPSEPLFVRLGLTMEALVGELGLDLEVAELAMECRESEDIVQLAELAPGWQAVALIDLSAGRSIAVVKETLAIDAGPVAATQDADEALTAALRHPASQLQFVFIEDNAELKQAIEDPNFAAWRVFLHPEQRKYASRSWRGSFRLSGGAGTGKTVVLLHRARFLAKRDPDARIVLTTFNKTLADALQRDLKVLDPTLPLAEKLGDTGIFISGIDAMVRSVVPYGSPELPKAVETVLGSRTNQIRKVTGSHAWRNAIASDGDGLRSDLRSTAFFEAEYELIVLPNRVKTFAEYAKVRRPGRGVSLDRTARAAVWNVIEAYRLNAGIDGSIDFAEAAAIASEVLNGTEAKRVDHVLVDEGQDLNPTHWQFLRALVAEGSDDLFIAEDSQQRIYGNKVILGRYGIKIVGRSQRLRLNYRTTDQNLRYAVSILTSSQFVDLEDEVVDAEISESAEAYRSARLGPKPRLIQAISVTDELEQTAQIVKGWLSDLRDGEGAETIGILVRTEQVGEQLVRALDERQVRSRFVPNKEVPSGAPVIMTMHRAKGMEFARVIIFGVDAAALPLPFALKNAGEADRADFLQREKSLLYVAATRARDELVIVWEGEPSELLPTVVNGQTTV